MNREPVQPSFYDLLGVPSHASPREIRAAFLRLAQRFHPDLNEQDADADQRFKQIRRIYETLIDPLARAAYDQDPRRFRLTEADIVDDQQDTVITRPAPQPAWCPTSPASDSPTSTDRSSSAGFRPRCVPEGRLSRETLVGTLSCVLGFAALLSVVALLLWGPHPKPDSTAERETARPTPTDPADGHADHAARPNSSPVGSESTTAVESVISSAEALRSESAARAKSSTPAPETRFIPWGPTLSATAMASPGNVSEVHSWNHGLPSYPIPWPPELPGPPSATQASVEFGSVLSSLYEPPMFLPFRLPQGIPPVSATDRTRVPSVNIESPSSDAVPRDTVPFRDGSSGIVAPPLDSVASGSLASGSFGGRQGAPWAGDYSHNVQDFSRRTPTPSAGQVPVAPPLPSSVPFAAPSLGDPYGHVRTGMSAARSTRPVEAASPTTPPAHGSHDFGSAPAARSPLPSAGPRFGYLAAENSVVSRARTPAAISAATLGRVPPATSYPLATAPSPAPASPYGNQPFANGPWSTASSQHSGVTGTAGVRQVGWPHPGPTNHTVPLTFGPPRHVGHVAPATAAIPSMSARPFSRREVNALPPANWTTTSVVELP